MSDNPPFTPHVSKSTNGTNGSSKSKGRSPFNRLEPLQAMMASVLANATTSRRKLAEMFTDPRRSIEDECGYPSLGTIAPSEAYENLYNADPIPARVVEVFPKECFQVQPEIYEDEDPKVVTDFEAAIKDLDRNLGPDTGESFYQDSQGSQLMSYFRRLDIISGIGQYGVMLLGFDDAKRREDLASPVTPKKGRKLQFLRCFPDTLARITASVTDDTDPRFGRPLMYEITLHDPRSQTQGTSFDSTVVRVHWTRVIHVADTSHHAFSSEIFAIPRMHPVYTRLLDLRKLYGGSAEMYWRGAFPGYTIESQPGIGADEVELDTDSIRDQMENFINSLQRYLATTGATVKSLAPQVVDPTPQILVQIQAICIKLGIPLRVFLGSERGEVAHSQDDSAWNDRLKERQLSYLSPWMFSPTFNRLIWAGVLPKPKGFSVHWPDLTSQSNLEKAQIALLSTQALGHYANSKAWAIVPTEMYLKHFQSFPDKDIQEAIKQTEELRGLLIQQLKAEIIKTSAPPPSPSPKSDPKSTAE